MNTIRSTSIIEVKQLYKRWYYYKTTYKKNTALISRLKVKRSKK